MRSSLRGRLVLALGGVMLGTWATSAAFTYRDTHHMIDELTDAHLQQSADMLLRFTEQVSPAEDSPTHGLILETNPAEEFSFRIWSGPSLPAQGPHDITRDGKAFRVVTALSASGRLVEVAIRQDVREGFSSRVAAHILHPLWIAVPLLVLLIWAAVRWALRPLVSVTAGVAHRSASELDPLPSDKAPVEILPLVAALNDLFGRIRDSRARDRRFAADAAHELRTPLAAIKTHAQLAEQAPDLAACRHAIRNVVAGVDRGTRVVEQLLALARIDGAGAAPALLTTDLFAIARQTVMDLAPKAATRNVDLGLSGGTSEPVCLMGNAELLSVLVRNLVENALNYVQAGGEVSVSVEGEGNTVTLRVEDNGPGLSPELRHRAADRFFRAAGTEVAGSGLGLSIVTAIAELHGATLALEERTDQPGLCARVTFQKSGRSRI